jgi:hypothetical protein
VCQYWLLDRDLSDHTRYPQSCYPAEVPTIETAVVLDLSSWTCFSFDDPTVLWWQHDTPATVGFYVNTTGYTTSGWTINLYTGTSPATATHQGAVSYFLPIAFAPCVSGDFLWLVLSTAYPDTVCVQVTLA